MKSLDLIQWIGAKTCSFAGEVTQPLFDEPACYSKAEAWTMGVLVLATIILVLGAGAFREWRKRRQTSYL